MWRNNLSWKSRKLVIRMTEDKRVIKFRAWDKYRGENGLMLENHSLKSISLTGIGLQEDMEWMQFIGLIDNNKKEMYEGDIIKYQHFPLSKNPIKTGIIKYIHTGYYITNSKGDLKSTIPDYREVIGNIHENKELMEME